MREIKHDVLIALNKLYGSKPFCKKCDSENVITFSSGWRIINKSHNVQASNLEPACDLHKDELRIEKIREPSERFTRNTWFEKKPKAQKTQDENDTNGVELGEKDSKNKTGT